MKPVLYYIENTIDERNTRISGYFLKSSEAVNALKSCSDWYRYDGSGTIVKKEFGLHGQILCRITTLSYHHNTDEWEVYGNNGKPVSTQEIYDHLSNNISLRF